MLLTEQIQLKYSKELSKLCHKTKNLYNLAMWYYRQDFFNLNNFLNYYDLDFMLKNKNAYKNLPAQTSQQIIKLIVRNWKSYFRAIKEYRQDFKKFKNKPKIPGYKKKNGESIVIFTNQNTRIKNGRLYFPKKCYLEPIKTRIKEYQQIRIIPKGNYYNLEIIYEKEELDLKLNKNNCIGIDLGLNNLITTANNIGLCPTIVKGGIVKSINQYYNKKRAELQSKINKENKFIETRRLNRLTRKRNNKIRDYFHKSSKKLIEYCIKNNIGTIIIGHNKGWKQKCNIGKRNNQNFVNFPFYRLIWMIEYKARLVGIEVKSIREDYTSKCSALDLESLEKHDIYKGKRIKRGLFSANDGTLINADVNGAYNIMRKVVPTTLLGNGIEALVLMPQII